MKKIFFNLFFTIVIVFTIGVSTSFAASLERCTGTSGGAEPCDATAESQIRNAEAKINLLGGTSDPCDNEISTAELSGDTRFVSGGRRADGSDTETTQ